MDRRDFLGGIACLFPVLASKAVPVIGDVIDPTKPVVIESPQIITPGQVPEIILGCTAPVRYGENESLLGHVLITQITARRYVGPYVGLRGELKYPKQPRQWNFEIHGIGMPGPVEIQQLAKDETLRACRKARR